MKVFQVFQQNPAPLTIKQVADIAGVSWEAADRTVKLFVHLGLVAEIEPKGGGRKRYMLKRAYEEYRHWGELFDIDYVLPYLEQTLKDLLQMDVVKKENEVWEQLVFALSNVEMLKIALNRVKRYYGLIDSEHAGVRSSEDNT